MVQMSYQISWSPPGQGEPKAPQKSKARTVDTIVEDLCKTLDIPVTQPLITVEQAAQVLLLKKQTLDKWRCTQPEKLPFVKSGRLVRYRVVDVARFILKERSSQKSR